MRLIPSIIAIILWLVLGIFIKPCFDTNLNCGDENLKANIDVKKGDLSSNSISAAKKAAGPLLFNWNKAEAVMGDGWEATRQAILNGLKDGEKLEITGLYKADEAKPVNFENLGLARADEISKLFKPPLPDDRINIRGKLVNPSEGDKTNMFKSVEFRNLKNTAAIKEIDDRTLIYFPFNSTNKLQNADVEAYLNAVADRVIKSGERVRLTGHTDSVSSSESNIRLGQRRANIVKQYLISKGVSSSKIIADSKGESQPASGAYVDNKESATDRRTELQIIK
ncbi:MAG: outer membrane protein OmpA-like peptidoglycan-associated protein [Saprospiraceae bacterium]|jgi:outer membrane protein OmpA-like peptidoglycan-associated protein|tara:strand:- start:292 stop:1134 length:843 start_codon:yes stop_codon:yes gene_type:complete